MRSSRHACCLQALLAHPQCDLHQDLQLNPTPVYLEISPIIYNVTPLHLLWTEHLQSASIILLLSFPERSQGTLLGESGSLPFAVLEEVHW